MGLIWLAIIGWVLTQGKSGDAATDPAPTDAAPEGEQTVTITLPQPTADVVLNNTPPPTTPTTPTEIKANVAPSNTVTNRAVSNVKAPVYGTALPAAPANPYFQAAINYAVATKPKAPTMAEQLKAAAVAAWGTPVTVIPGSSPPLLLPGGSSISSKMMWFSLEDKLFFVRADNDAAAQKMGIYAISTTTGGTSYKTTYGLPGKWVQVASKVWLA